MNFQPYTYLIGWTKLNKFYYGVQYGCKIVIANPKNLWTTYFTSSTLVKDLRQQEGEPDVVQIRRVFSCAKKAKRWEETVIRRGGLLASEKWLNRGNNGSFKGVTMDETQIESLKRGHSKNRNRKRVYYTDGINTTWGFEDSFIPPEGWVKGVSEKIKIANSEAQKRFYAEVDPNVLKRRGELHSLKTKGVPKPKGFGEKISKALTGIKRPYNEGEHNPSATPEARKKISESWKTRIRGNWFNDGVSNFWIKHGEEISPELVRGKVKVVRPKKVWVNDGIKEFKINETDSLEDNWVLGRLRNAKNKNS